MTRSGPVRIHSVLASAALLLAAMNPLAAQDAFDDTGYEGLELVGAIALMTPLGNLTEDAATFGTTINVNLAYGLEAVMWASNRWGFGASGWYSPAKLQARDLPDGIFEVDLGDAKYAVGTLQAIYRFRGEGSRNPLEPYFALGGGVRHIDVDEDLANPEVVDSTDPAGTIAGGIRLQGLLSKMMIRIEIRDNFSIYESPTTGESRLQNDVLLSFGVGVRF